MEVIIREEYDAVLAKQERIVKTLNSDKNGDLIETDENGNEIKNPIPKELQKLYDYLDVFNIDENHGILSNKKEYTIIVEGDYDGHVYAWKNKPYLSLMGIRKSYFSKKKGIANKIIDKAITIAKEEGFSHIVLLRPLYSMICIAKKRGFVECTSNKIMTKNTPITLSGFKNCLILDV